MADDVEGKWVVPNPQVPRMFGILNVVFGVLLILYGASTIAMLVVYPAIQSTTASWINEQQAAQKAQRDAKIAELKKEEEAAKTEEDKKSVAGRREALEKASEPDLSGIMDEAMGFAKDKQYIAYTAAGSATGILLNVLMVISGVALLRMAEWGRRMALGVAWLKLVRWLAIVIVTLVVIVPMTTVRMEKVFQEIEKQTKVKSGRAGAPFPMATVAQFVAVATAASAVVSALVASIYPVLTLWFLTRPTTRAAFLPRAKPAGPALEFESGAGP